MSEGYHPAIGSSSGVGNSMTTGTVSTKSIQFFSQSLTPPSNQYCSQPPLQGNTAAGLDVATQMLLLGALQNPSGLVNGASNAQLLLSLLQETSQQRNQPVLPSPACSNNGHSAQPVPPGIMTAYPSLSQPLNAVKPAPFVSQAPMDSATLASNQQALPQQLSSSLGTAATSNTTKALLGKTEGTASRAVPGTATVVPQQQPVLDKKQQKRAANRISAQQSRKRKKLYIEGLKVENDELRKLGLVLTILPDLIITFDTSGTLLFASHACEQVFGSTANDLRGTCFWSWLCSKSARRLKAAFMDALAARQPEESSVSLGGKVWEIQIKNKSSGSSKASFSLNGVVHFSEGSPECVCTIRRSETDGSAPSLQVLG
eukprot:Nitzschia sp. Nitz4//NODE_202_length_38933_cov_72.610268//29288//30480//NITZ4_additional_000026-RA//-1//CDS//3329531798//3476//frame0